MSGAYMQAMSDDAPPTVPEPKKKIKVTNWSGELDSHINPIEVKETVDSMILNKKRNVQELRDMCARFVRKLRRRFVKVKEETDNDREWNRGVIEMKVSWYIQGRIADDDDCILAYHFTELMTRYIASDNAEIIVEFWRRADESDLEGSFDRWIEWVETAKRRNDDITAFADMMKWLFQRYHTEDNQLELALKFLAKKEETFRDLCAGSAEALARMVKIVYYAGDEEGEKAIKQFDTIREIFNTDDKKKVMLAVAKLAEAAKENINSCS